MPRPRIHYLHTGPWPWYIGFTTEEAAFQREMKRLRVKDAGPGVKAGSNAATHHLVNGSTNMALIVMHRPSRRASKEQYASLLAHEVVHVVQEMGTYPLPTCTEGCYQRRDRPAGEAE